MNENSNLFFDLISAQCARAILATPVPACLLLRLGGASSWPWLVKCRLLGRAKCYKLKTPKALGTALGWHPTARETRVTELH